jgi:hypothetical protein
MTGPLRRLTLILSSISSEKGFGKRRWHVDLAISEKERWASADEEESQTHYGIHRENVAHNPQAKSADQLSGGQSARQAAPQACRWTPRILPILLRQLERLCRTRWGQQLPNNKDGRETVIVAAHTIAGLGGEVVKHIVAWASLRASWLPDERARQLAEHIDTNPIKLGADTAGWRLKLTIAERTALRITTIGAVGQNKAQRAAERKRRQRVRAQARRAAQPPGKPRGRPSKGKPWLAEGISRAAWYRRDKNACAAGNTVKIDTPYAAHGISSHTTGTERGEVAEALRTRREPGQIRQSGPHRGCQAASAAKARSKSKSSAEGMPTAHHLTTGRGNLSKVITARWCCRGCSGSRARTGSGWSLHRIGGRSDARMAQWESFT